MILMQPQTIPIIITQPDSDWYSVQIPTIDGKLHCGTRIYVPEHEVRIAKRYPTLAEEFEGTPAGTLIAGEIGGQKVTQAWAARLLKEHGYRLIPEFEDFWVRQKLSKNHTAFDQNFERAEPFAWGYLADHTKPYGSGEIEGLTVEDKQEGLVQRVAYMYDASGELQELGITTLAPDGMVPMFTKQELEGIIGAEGLNNLGKLRGKDIYEKSDEIVDVRNPLGHAQLTFPHDYKINDILAHSHHSYRPEQNYGDMAGLRDASWSLHGGERCFNVGLGQDAGDSDPRRSFPLVVVAGK